MVLRHRATCWLAGLSLGTALIAGNVQPLFGQPKNDPLERAKALREIADQKADTDIRQIISEAEKLAKSNPDVAVQRLKRALVSLDLAVSISPQKRNELVRLIQNKVRDVETAAKEPAIGTAREKNPAIKKFDEYVKEAAEVKKGIAEVEEAHAKNQYEVARQKIAELAVAYPNNPAVIALQSQGTFGDRAADAKQLAAEQSRRVVYALNSVQRSALPPATETVEFPKNWAELVKRRADAEIELSPEDEAILRALETRIGNGLKDAPFLETVQTLSNAIDKEIYLDRGSLEDAGLDLQRAVTMPGNVPARTALRAILQAQGLTFVVKDQIIQVVTLERARDLQITRAYYMGELVQVSGPLPGGAVMWGPYLDFQQTMNNANMIMKSITESIDPLIWKEKGGPATITFHYPSMSMIVRAPAEVHSSFSGKLSKSGKSD